MLKISSDGKEKPLLVLGEAFVPGSDKNHFCQPTDVAVDPDNGNIYVSDGYCNTRILTFSPEGKYLSHWGAGTHPTTQTLLLLCTYLTGVVTLPFRGEHKGEHKAHYVLFM